MNKYKTSLIINNTTRDELRTIGMKDQTYDDIIQMLLKSYARLKDLER